MHLNDAPSPAFTDFEAWVSAALKGAPRAAAFCFNLYEHEDSYAVQVVALERFDRDDPDWAVNPTFFTPEQYLFRLEKGPGDDDWQAALSTAEELIERYLAEGARASVLRESRAVACGFVDGDLHILWATPDDGAAPGPAAPVLCRRPAPETRERSRASVMRAILIASAFLLVTACGESGTWVDHPRNFERAWGAEAPRGVVVVHSWYWRSGHFTREEIYYFQLRADAEYAEAFATANGLALHKPGDLNGFRFMSPRPSWFAPKDPAAYKVWSTGTKHPSAVVMFDPATSDVFIHAAQL